MGHPEKLVSIPCNGTNQSNCKSSRSDVVCTEHFAEFSVLDISGVHEIFVKADKKYFSRDHMLISVLVK